MMARILLGDVRDVLATLPSDHFHCAVTSPPYWGLRDYGIDGQLGLERTVGEHIAAMVSVFGDIRRVLRPSGTVWLNYGDCYATSPNGRSAEATKASGSDDRTFRDKPFSTIGGVFKAKDLCMVPNRLAIALQEDGWWVRSEIIWHKSNPMPESVKDRPTVAHEKIFLLTKAERYYFDADAIREDSSGLKKRDASRGSAASGDKKRRGVPPRHEPYASCDQSGLDRVPRGAGRHPRNVWTIATKPFPEAHFATFPPELAERCILAGCPPGGEVLDPFGGAGTTAVAAMKLGRRSTSIELNPEYVRIARRRIRAEGKAARPMNVDSIIEMKSGGAE